VAAAAFGPRRRRGGQGPLETWADARYPGLRALAPDAAGRPGREELGESRRGENDMVRRRREVLFGIAALPAASLPGRRPLPGLVATVYNGHELDLALRAAGPGSSVLLAPGDYGDAGGRFSLAGGRVSLRVQAPGRATLRQHLAVEGAFAELDGLAFRSGVTLAGDGVLIANSTFRGQGVRVTGVNAVVYACDIADFTGYGVDVRASALNTRVRDNRIRNGSSAVALGQSTIDTDIPLGADVVGNWVEACTGYSESVMVKSSGNSIRGNYFLNCRNITNRHGEDNTYEGNVLDGCTGLVAHDRGTRIIGNRLVNTRSIRIMGGDVTWNSKTQGAHPQAYDTYLAGNNGLLVIGELFAGDTLPAVNTTVASHDGTIRLKTQVNTTLPGGGGGGSAEGTTRS
jgi:hypothetical protein